ncbi:MAG: alpha-ketoglutarate-dependent dioxygenase AlkB family protein [Pseudomonadales bacterium]
MKQQHMLKMPTSDFTSVELSGADVRLYPDLLIDRSDEWFDVLREQIAWQQHQLTLFGKTLNAPRLSAWYGDPDAHYSYSAIKLLPQAWITPLRDIKQIVEVISGAKFNSVLANLYRSGSDSMGWHADDEAELGAEPVIASVSLGAQRRMRWRHKQREFASQSTDLPNGSLLLMRGHTQHEWQHCLPKVASASAERINLTYRLIHSTKL